MCMHIDILLVIIYTCILFQDMLENFVHKQGFLVKQGGRVKNWRKRLFVLNTDGLSYYKTEQVQQTIIQFLLNN